MTDYDSPWKEMLDGYLPDFMAFHRLGAGIAGRPGNPF